MIGTKTRARTQVGREHLRWINNKLTRWTNLKPDFDRLSADDKAALHELVVAASASEDPKADVFNPDRLGKRERAKLERLVEKAADQPEAFAKARDSADLRRMVREIARDVLVTKPTKTQEGRFFDAVHKQLHLKDGGTAVFADHLGVLVLLLDALLSAEMPPGALPNSARVEAGEDGAPLIVWRRGNRLFGNATGNAGPRIWETLKHLERNAWITLTGSPDVKIQLGSRARRIFEVKP